jgi:acyl-CoA reductase-like NAD-dependent aldehyde dehydrogenase
MTNDEVDASIATAHDRFATWRRLPFAQRPTLLRRGSREA